MQLGVESQWAGSPESAAPRVAKQHEPGAGRSSHSAPGATAHGEIQGQLPEGQQQLGKLCKVPGQPHIGVPASGRLSHLLALGECSNAFVR